MANRIAIAKCLHCNNNLHISLFKWEESLTCKAQICHLCGGLFRVVLHPVQCLGCDHSTATCRKAQGRSLVLDVYDRQY